jgi:hypothetical protein
LKDKLMSKNFVRKKYTAVLSKFLIIALSIIICRFFISERVSE